MKDLFFRELRADEIECRIGMAREDGVSILLYKDARVDQNLLDETVGAMNWQRIHTRDNKNCIVQVWDDDKGQWVSKEDTGTESNTEKEKGLASDSFKRSCTNWGIGRELYTAPFIWVPAKFCEKLKKYTVQGKEVWKCKDEFFVSDIEIVEKNIVKLNIAHSKTKQNCFIFSATPNTPKQTPKKLEAKSAVASDEQIEEIIELCDLLNYSTATIAKTFKVNDIEELSYTAAESVIKQLTKQGAKK